MYIHFRADASNEIGIGHVMRCLTLATELRDRGAQCTFICRKQPGHLLDLIQSSGIEAIALEQPSDLSDFALQKINSQITAHQKWLGVHWYWDAVETIAALGKVRPDYLVVDHYAIDKSWELLLKPNCGRIIVIDDLANRDHHCDILIDQTFERKAADYQSLVSRKCNLLLGPKYAMLRPEFSKLRQQIRPRTHTSEIKKILISLGGGDNEYWILKLLNALSKNKLIERCHLHIIHNNPSSLLLKCISDFSNNCFGVSIEEFTSRMGSWMIWADISIGAAGSTSWERCCMALPSVLLILEENQRRIGCELGRLGAAVSIEMDVNFEYLLNQSLNKLICDSIYYTNMSKIAYEVCDGLGVKRLINEFSYETNN